ncbi:MAG: hypothetical protein GOVbin1454_40 [Prokaryotic dsDNA virus sp.]|nr:MAG: hypothetical protein GOVbin1454_40 [Prokaryotic dsDNA virus sp.]|tara:strand:+ start:1682 stop:2227 length:546 start_codon:yes stop_codon:yes gene_type:complete
MGQLLAAIENSAIKEIDIGPMRWRIKKICSADLASVGHAALAMSQGLEGRKTKRRSKKGSEENDESAIQDLIANSSAEKLKTMAGLKDAIVAAGLIAVINPDTGAVEKVKCTLKSEHSDAQNGVIWVGAIPNHIADQLFSEILDLSTDGGAAVDRLRAFRGKSDQFAGDRPDSQTLRQTAE